MESPSVRLGIIVDPVKDAGLVRPCLKEDDRAVGIGAAPAIALLMIGIPPTRQHLAFKSLTQVG